MRPMALVTGASTGIGLAISLELAQKGFDVAVTSRSYDRAFESAQRVSRYGVNAYPFAFDAGNFEGPFNLIERVVKEVGRLDALVNNAAELIRCPAIDATPEEFDRQFSVNVRAPFFLSQAFARYLVGKGKVGAIVNIGSTHARAVLRDRSIYGMTKAALEQMTRALAIEWASYGIRVNAVIPSTVATSSREAAFEAAGTKDDMISRIPAGRFARPEEVSACVSFLLDSKVSFITGECLVIDGGLTLV